MTPRTDPLAGVPRLIHDRPELPMLDLRGRGAPTPERVAAMMRIKPQTGVAVWMLWDARSPNSRASVNALAEELHHMADDLRTVRQEYPAFCYIGPRVAGIICGQKAEAAEATDTKPEAASTPTPRPRRRYTRPQQHLQTEDGFFQSFGGAA